MKTELRDQLRAGVLALGLTLGSMQAFAFYDPFEDVSSLVPSDELETRMWDESRLLKSQLIRPEHQASLQGATRLVQSVFARHFPALQDVVKVHVYKETELAVVGTPHGEIFISSGLLLRMESEEDLVVLLARELAHVYQRDSARTLSYARTGSNLKEIFSTGFAAYNVTSGLINLNSLAGSLTTLSPDLLLQQLQLTPEKLLESGGSVFAKLLKEQLREDIEGLGRNLGGVLVHRLSVQAVAALVKTSLYGYSDRIENQADRFALTFLQSRYGHTAHYESFFQRLHHQSQADGDVPFLSFYSNSKRLQSRLDSATEWKARQENTPIALKLAEKNPAPANLSVPSSFWLETQRMEPLIADEPVAAPVNMPAQSVEVPIDVAEAAAVEGRPDAPVAAQPEGGGASEVQQLPEVTTVASAVPVDQTASAYLMNEDVKQFFLQALDQESRDGAPRRFLQNLERLHQLSLIEAVETRAFQTRALRSTRQAQDTEKALELLRLDLVQNPQDWGRHQLLADVYVEMKTYDQALAHYDKAIELSGDDERKLFIIDRKTRAEKLLAREAKRK